MSHSKLFGSNHPFEENSSTSSSTIKLDECGEALTETTAFTAYTDFSVELSAMDTLKDNPILTTASMPIPSRNNNGGSVNRNMDLSDFEIEFEVSQDIKMPVNEMFDNSQLGDDFRSSPTLFTIHANAFNGAYANSDSTDNSNHNGAAGVLLGGGGGSGSYGSGDGSSQFNTQMHMWNEMAAGAGAVTKTEPGSIEDDAIFQVDKADLIQGATLTDLNEDPLLDLSIDDFILPQDNSYFHEDGPSLHSLQNVISPLNSCTISPNNYSNGENMQATYVQLLDEVQSQIGNSIAYGQNLSPVGEKISPPPQSVMSTRGPEISLYDNVASMKYMNPSSTAMSAHAAPLNSLHHNFHNVISATSPRSSSTLQTISSRKYKSPVSGSLNASSQPNIHSKRSALHDLLRKESAQHSRSPEQLLLGQSVPGSSMLANGNIALGPNFRSRTVYGNVQQNSSRLSSSAPTQLGMEQIWQRREPRPHLLSTSSMAEAGSTSSLSTGGVLSPDAPDFSLDEDSDDDSDHYEDYSSDNESDDESKSKTGEKAVSKKERYFWQYNVQAKGPKGQRLVIKTEVEDPHVLNVVTDPVFSPNCSVRGIKHSGKARKGDGNDLTPNPRKLNNIGRELDKLCRVINDMTPVSELPFNVRPKTRKEKNKLASRACRLKKKAQHEANKIKLFGLEHEHKRLITGINQLKTIITNICNSPHNKDTKDEIQRQIEKVIKSALKVRIAGESTEFVNQILSKVKAGDPKGGLGDI